MEHLSRAAAGDPAGKLTLFLDADDYPLPDALEGAKGRQLHSPSGDRGDAFEAAGRDSQLRTAAGGSSRHRNTSSLGHQAASSAGATEAPAASGGMAAPPRCWLHAIVEPILYNPGQAEAGGSRPQLAAAAHARVQAAHNTSAPTPEGGDQDPVAVHRQPRSISGPTPDNRAGQGSVPHRHPTGATHAIARDVNRGSSGSGEDAGKVDTAAFCWWPAVVITFQPAERQDKSSSMLLTASGAQGEGATDQRGVMVAADAAKAVELGAPSIAAVTEAPTAAATAIVTDVHDRALNCGLTLASTASFTATPTAAAASDGDVAAASAVRQQEACRTAVISELDTSLTGWSESRPMWPLVPQLQLTTTGLASPRTNEDTGGGGAGDDGGGAGAGGGSRWAGEAVTRLREQMVLASLTPITTAVSVSSGTVYYQNAESVGYFGGRAQPTVASAQTTAVATAAGGCGAAVSAVAAAAAAVATASTGGLLRIRNTTAGAAAATAAGSGVGGGVGVGVGVGGSHTTLECRSHILQELFCLEPHKLDRLLVEVCVEGRVWRGIVRVPASCALRNPRPPGMSPSAPAPAPFAEATPAAADAFSGTGHEIATWSRHGPAAPGEAPVGDRKKWTPPDYSSYPPTKTPQPHPQQPQADPSRPQQQQPLRRPQSSAVPPPLPFHNSNAAPSSLAASSSLMASDMRAAATAAAAAALAENPALSAVIAAAAAAKATAAGGTVTTASPAHHTSGSVHLSLTTNATAIIPGEGEGGMLRLPSNWGPHLRASQGAAVTAATDPLATSTWGLFVESNAEHRGMDSGFSGGMLAALATAPGPNYSLRRYLSSVHPTAPCTFGDGHSSGGAAAAPRATTPPLLHLQPGQQKEHHHHHHHHHHHQHLWSQVHSHGGRPEVDKGRCTTAAAKAAAAAAATTVTAAAAAAAVLEEEVPAACLLGTIPAPKVPVGPGGGARRAAVAMPRRLLPSYHLSHAPTTVDDPTAAAAAAAAEDPDQRSARLTSGSFAAAAVPVSVGSFVAAAEPGEPTAAAATAAVQGARSTLDRRSRVGRGLARFEAFAGIADGSSVWAAGQASAAGLQARTSKISRLVGRTPSLTAGPLRVYPSARSATALSSSAAAVAAAARQPVRRALSRGQVEVSASAGAGGGTTFARILAFTSSLRSTPTAVQATLQQAVAGSLLTLGGAAAAVGRGGGGNGFVAPLRAPSVPPGTVTKTGVARRAASSAHHALLPDSVPSINATAAAVAAAMASSAVPSTAVAVAAANADACGDASTHSASAAEAANSRALFSGTLAAGIAAYRTLRSLVSVSAIRSPATSSRTVRTSANGSSRPQAPADDAPLSSAATAAATAAAAAVAAAMRNGGAASAAGSVSTVSRTAGATAPPAVGEDSQASGLERSLRPQSTAAKFIFGARRRRPCQTGDAAVGSSAPTAESGNGALRYIRRYTASNDELQGGGDVGAMEAGGSIALGHPPAAGAPASGRSSRARTAGGTSKAPAAAAAGPAIGDVAALGGSGAVAVGLEGRAGGGEGSRCAAHGIASAPAGACMRQMRAACAGDGGGEGGGGAGGSSGDDVGSGGAAAVPAAASAAGVAGVGAAPIGVADRLLLPLRPGTCWHEVVASPAVDPVTGQDVIIVSQTDISAKVEAERHIALVSETEHRLLEQIFPRHVLAYMTEEDRPSLAAPRSPAPASGGTGVGARPPQLAPRAHAAATPRDINKLATSHSEVTLLFADIQGFTPMCKMLEPRVVMAFLNDLFTRFDSRLDEFGVYKVETIGDCYFVAGGLIHEDEYGMPVVRARESHADPLHAEKVLMFGKAMLSAAAQVTLPTTGGPVRMRIGIHSGPVVSGVVGQRMPRFCLFGDTVNTASRMESTGVPGCIHASEAARNLLRNEMWVPTGGIEVKGKGLMNTYLWAPPDSDSHRALLLCRGLAACSRQTLTAASSSGAGGGPGTGAGLASNSNELLPHLLTHRRHAHLNQWQQRRKHQFGRFHGGGTGGGGQNDEGRASDSDTSGPAVTGAGNNPLSPSFPGTFLQPEQPSPLLQSRQHQLHQQVGAGAVSSGGQGQQTCSTHAANSSSWAAIHASLGGRNGGDDDSFYSLVKLLLPK